MNKLKKTLSYVITALIICVGITCIYGFQKYHQQNPDSLTGLIWIFGAILVFHPAFEYWLAVAKRTLNIKDEDKTN